MIRRRRSAADLGDEVWDLIEPHGDEGLPTQAVLERTGMSRGQFDRAKAWIKDKKCALERKCFVVDGTNAITTDPDRCVAAASRELAGLYRRAERIHASLIAPLPPEAQNLPAVRLLASQCESIKAAMSMLEAAGFSAPSAAKTSDQSPRSRSRRKT